MASFLAAKKSVSVSDLEAVLLSEFGKNVGAGFSVCRGKVRLRFVITLTLKQVIKPWLAECELFTVIFVACDLLLASCCARDTAGRGQEERGCYVHRASSEVLTLRQML